MSTLFVLNAGISPHPTTTLLICLASWRTGARCALAAPVALAHVAGFPGIPSVQQLALLTIYDPSKRPWKRTAPVVNGCLPVILFEYQVNKCKCINNESHLTGASTKCGAFYRFMLSAHTRANSKHCVAIVSKIINFVVEVRKIAFLMTHRAILETGRQVKNHVLHNICHSIGLEHFGTFKPILGCQVAQLLS